jgi:hypothetical protein
MPTWWEKPSPAPASTMAAKPPRPRAAVTAEQINDGNAQEMAGALLDELDRDAQAQSLPSTDKTAGDVKPVDSNRR